MVVKLTFLLIYKRSHTLCVHSGAALHGMLKMKVKSGFHMEVNLKNICEVVIGVYVFEIILLSG